MSENVGKKFEDVVKRCFEKVDGVFIERIHDQTTGFSGSKNGCDFHVYKFPYFLYLECKSVHGNTLNWRNITDNQWASMDKWSKVDGVIAGVLVWFVDRDITAFIPIESMKWLRHLGAKSVHADRDIINNADFTCIILGGRKLRKFFDYDMESFLRLVGNL